MHLAFTEKRCRMSGRVIIIGLVKVSNGEHLISVRDKMAYFKWTYGTRTAHDITWAAMVMQEFHAHT